MRPTRAEDTGKYSQSVPRILFLTYLASRFFFADERQENGGSKAVGLDGPAHGDFFAQLATHEGDVPWQATFVKDKGYVQFK